MSVIVCKSCGHENEVGRVYCNDCGTKLDLSAFQREAGDDDRRYTPTEVRRHVKGKVGGVKSPRVSLSIPWGGIFVTLIVIAVVGGLGYGGLQLYMQPNLDEFTSYRGLNDMSEKEQGFYYEEFDKFSNASSDLEFAISDNRAHTTVIPQDQLNIMITQKVKPYTKEIGPIKAEFKDVFVSLRDDGKVTVYMHYTVFGQKFVLTYVITPILDSGLYNARYHEVKAGRLQIPSFLHSQVNGPLRDLGSRFANEQKLVQECESLTVSEGKVTLKYAPKNAPASSDGL